MCAQSASKHEDPTFKAELRTVFSTFSQLMTYQENRVKQVYKVQVSRLGITLVIATHNSSIYVCVCVSGLTSDNYHVYANKTQAN